MPRYFLLFAFVLSTLAAMAHPMPSSVVRLSVMETFIRGDAKMPLFELSNAVGESRTANLQDPFFTRYFTEHIQAVSGKKNWTTVINRISLISGSDPVVGNYQEVEVQFVMTPPAATYLRKFTFDYDVIMHQVVTHSALVYVEQDWNNGIQGEGDGLQIGMIRLDLPTEKIFPLEVNLEAGNWWKGFKGMLLLGMQHIRLGTDHLLFLFVLLLPAMLMAKGKAWGGYGGLRYSASRLLKIVTAFTTGHSVTLIFGALGLIRFPGQPIEILIAVTILVSAIHAIRPVFPGKEILIAGGFGLIHGLAFAAALANLDLSAGKMVLSILGFNLGIELMQLLVIALLVPSLILLSKTGFYKWVRIAGAAASGIAAIAWIAQRSTGKTNPIAEYLDMITSIGPWLIIAFAIISLLVYFGSFAAQPKNNIA